MVRNRSSTNRGAVSTSQPTRRVERIRFAPLGPSDLARAIAIERSCFPKPWPEEAFGEMLGGSSAFQTLTARPPRGELLAYLIFTSATDELHILNFAVDPTFQRQGIGAALLERLHEVARRKKIKHVFLEVRDSNLAAKTLYEKLGYKAITRRKEYYAQDQEDAILMVAHLTGSTKKK